MRIIDRFDKYMEYMGINDNQVTVNCCLSVGLLGNARRGKTDIGKKAIEKILIFYQNLNKVWLLTGEGEMIKTQQSLAKSNNDMVVVNAEAWDIIKQQSEVILRQSESMELKDKQIDELINSLKKTNVHQDDHAECAAASGSDLEQ